MNTHYFKNRFARLFSTPRWVLKILLVIFIIGPHPSMAQTIKKQSFTFDVNIDLASRYIWRGSAIGNGPSLQPALTLTWKDFKFGTWGAYQLNGGGEAETDFYLSKSFGFIDIAIWDYWNFVETEAGDFFDYRKNSTAHLLEAQLLLSGKEKLPFNLLSSYLFYGADRSKSVYLELQYLHEFEKADFSAFAGCQVKGNYYAEKGGFVNLGFTVKKELPITDHFALPLSLSLINNPASRRSWLVAVISF